MRRIQTKNLREAEIKITAGSLYILITLNYITPLKTLLEEKDDGRQARGR